MDYQQVKQEETARARVFELIVTRRRSVQNLLPSHGVAKNGIA